MSKENPRSFEIKIEKWDDHAPARYWVRLKFGPYKKGIRQTEIGLFMNFDTACERGLKHLRGYNAEEQEDYK